MSVKHLTTAEFDTVVDSSPLTLVDFWATWCGPCRMVGPIIEKLGEKYESQAVIAKVDVDQEPDLARRFGVMSIPTVVFLKNGKEFKRMVGVQSPAAYMDVLDENL